MSYILDALRKADAQRERDPARGIHAQSARAAAAQGALQTGRYRSWFWAASAIGLAGVAGAGGFLYRDATPATPARPEVAVVQPALPQVSAPPPATPAVPPPVVAAAPAVLPPPVVVAPPLGTAPAGAGAPFRVERSTGSTAPLRHAAAGAQGGLAAPSQAIVPAQAAAAAPQSPTPGMAAVPTPAPAPAPAPAQASTAPPGMAPAPAPYVVPAPLPVAPPSLPVAGLPADAPKLVINGGVYSANKAQRMLIVNGQVVGEGADLGLGVTLEEIKPKSAVLRFRGGRYTVGY